MNSSYAFFFLCCLSFSVAEEESIHCSEDDSKQCAADEFFEVNVCQCSRCADLCQLRPDRSTDAACQHYCPGYYKRTNFSTNSLGTKESGSTSVALQSAYEDNALVKKPLFWTSVVSVFISVVATIVLIVLCTCRKSRPVLALHRIRRLPPSSQTRIPAQRSSDKGENSTGMLKTTEEVNDPLLSSAKNSSNAKCGETFAPLVSHNPVSMDSCAVVHETIIPHSSCLQKPRVASFEDSGFLVKSENMFRSNTNDCERTNMTAADLDLSSTTADCINCADTSLRTMDSRRPESIIHSCLFIRGLEKPSELMERCAFESGYFNSGSCTGATTWRGDSPVCSTVYAVTSGIATDKAVEMPSFFPVQETITWKDEGNNAADWKQYVELLPASFYDIGSKAPSSQSFDRGVKPKFLTSLHRILDLNRDASALQETDEETGLKKMQSDTTFNLNYLPEYIHPASHKEYARNQSIHELDKFVNGMHLSELNLRIRSKADAPVAILVPYIIKSEDRNAAKCEDDSNEADTALKTWKLNSSPKSTEAENLCDVKCVSYMNT